VVAEIAAGLVARGKPAATPVAVIANGTGREQEVVVSTLAGIAAGLVARDLPSPALIVMGEVAAMRARRVEIAAMLVDGGWGNGR